VPAPGLIDSNLTTRTVRVPVREVVYVKGVVEASLGLGVVFVGDGGELTVATPHSRADALDELLVDLEVELGSMMTRGALSRENATSKTTE